MRRIAKNESLRVLAIAGTYVVSLAFDLAAAKRKGLLGFAIHRADLTENEQYWLRGFKTFEQTYPNPPAGSLVSTEEHPVQAFLWGDYTAKPKHHYRYTVVPVYGKPKNLVHGPGVTVDVTTLSEDLGSQSIVFNRGVAGSQAFARKFPNVTKKDIEDPVRGKEARAWLSRGLEESILKFIGQAKGKRYSLRAAVYEFTWLPVLRAFKQASDSGADVKILYDHRGKASAKSPKVWQATVKALEAAKIPAKLTIKREANASYIAHNKFIVLLEDGKPVQVWTGSTNFTAGGIFGQSNVGHWIRMPQIAKAYLEYWTRLSVDPLSKPLEAGNDAVNVIPAKLPRANSVSTIFSPMKSSRALDWYGKRMAAARQTLCFTAAFGISKALAPALTKRKSYPRYVLVESEGNLPSQRAIFAAVRKTRNNIVAKGTFLAQGTGDEAADSALGTELQRWAAEHLTGLNTHVRFLHTKYLLVDPLTDQPLVISGSANFSTASTIENDENMVVMRGSTDVADVFLGEFMRLFHHFYFRDIVERLVKTKAGAKGPSPYLEPNDSWVKANFVKGSARALENQLYRSAMR